MRVEAEGSEIVLQNSNGDTIIIPKVHRQKALKYIEEGNHKAIDDLAGSLPFMEDYADDGSLVVNNPVDPPTKGKSTSTTSSKPKGIYTEEEFEQLSKEYEGPKYAKYGQPKDPSNPDDVWGCLGGSCKNLKTLYPQFQLHTDLFEKKGVFSAPKGRAPITEGYPITESTPSELKRKARSNSGGVDSWEYPYIIEDFGLGKVLFNYDIAKEKTDDAAVKKRLSYLENFDQTEIPLGSVLSFGDAKSAGYVHPQAKSYRGKDEPLYKHSMVKIGNVEGTDADGNPVVDVLYDDLGRILRVGKSTKADQTWGTITSELGAITTRDDLGDWTYSKLKGKEYAKPKEKVRPITNVLKDIEQSKQDKLKGIQSEVEGNLITKEEAEKKKKSIKTDPDRLYEFAQSLGVAPKKKK